jgi:hypothetical protein
MVTRGEGELGGIVRQREDESRVARPARQGETFVGSISREAKLIAALRLWISAAMRAAQVASTPPICGGSFVSAKATK